jgi:GTP-binding protein
MSRVILTLLVSAVLALKLSVSFPQTGKAPVPSIKLPSRLLRRRPGLPTDSVDRQPTDPAVEYDALEQAFNADTAAMQELFRSKLEEWRQLKEEGALEALRGEEASEEAVEALDQQLLSRRQRRRSRGEEQPAVVVDVVEDRARQLYILSDKLQQLDSSAPGAALAAYALFNEIKDKRILEVSLVEECLLCLSRLKDAYSYAVNAHKQYERWTDDGDLEGSPGFTGRFIDSCISTGMFEVLGDLAVALVARGKLTDDELQAPRLCAEISVCVREGGSFDDIVSRTIATLPLMRISQVNMVIRALGKARMSKRVLEVVEAMRAARLEPDEETFEFLANAFVVSVDEVAKVRSMRDLPDPDRAMPEVVFVGRSNVGKSSLVNFLVNRKALASTSATPGHTKHFHFFAVNRGRADLNAFMLVDVPGLGYAEADEGTQDSWRGLLERYLSVRESLCTVFHLVDSRHRLTPTDRLMIEIVTRAQEVRAAQGCGPFKYVVVLTKTDKASARDVSASARDVAEGTLTLAGTRVVQSSSVARRGRDELLRVLVDNLETWQ